MNINDFIIQNDTTIIDALKIIDKNGHGIAFVCDNFKLKGAVSDGDIRRFLLTDGDIQNRIDAIANHMPKHLLINSCQNSQEFMRINKITAVPILDQNQNILRIDFDNYNKVYKEANLELPVIIMAGGKGTRLYPYTQILPKPLIPIGDKTITEHIMERFERYGCKEFYMIVNYKKGLIKAFFEDKKQENLFFIDEDKYMGTGGGLTLLPDNISQTFFLTNCDVIIEADYAEIYKMHRENKNLVTIVCANKNFVIPYGIIEIEKNKQVLSMKEKPQYDFLINTGLYIIEKEIIDKIENGEFVHITDVIKRCMVNGDRVGTYSVADNEWLDMGQKEELEKMREILGE